MSLELSKKLSTLSPSVTLAITAKAKEMKDSGIDVVSFGAGEPDFNTPEFIQEAGIASIKAGKIRYTPASGLNDLKLAICKKLKNDNNLDYEPSNIVVSNGAKHSLFNALQAICNPGDEVIVPNPYWVSYPELVKVADATPVYVEVKESEGFKYSIEALDQALTSKTKAIIINSPNNPTGSMYDESELKALAEWAVKNEIYVISDEIYEKLVYDNHKHFSIAQFGDAIKNQTIVINGVSKAYAMTGWRIGYSAANKEITKMMSSYQSHATSNPCAISQYASIEALNGDTTEIEKMRLAFEKRRTLMTDLVNGIDGISCILPKGAFYIMVNITKIFGKKCGAKIINNSMDFSDLLLSEEKVAVIPGAGFGTDDFIRLSYATSEENIIKGLDRIKDFISKLND